MPGKFYFDIFSFLSLSAILADNCMNELSLKNQKYSLRQSIHYCRNDIVLLLGF